MVYHATFFIFILLVSSYLKWVYCRHQIIGLCFFIQHENLYPFQGVFGSCISSVQFSCSVVSDSLRPHEPQHARLPCPSPTPGVYSNSCPLSWWCHPTISSSIIPLSSCLQSFPASGYFPMSQFFASGGQSIGVSDSASSIPNQA